jgi:hypothetical protein
MAKNKEYENDIFDLIAKEPKEIREHWDWLISNGYKYPIDYMIEEMGLSKEEAKFRVKEAGGEFLIALREPKKSSLTKRRM